MKMREHLIFWTVLLITGILNLPIVHTLSGWTKWQNTDSPDDGGGDKEEGYYSCGAHSEATGTECRVVGKDISFTSDTSFLAPDVLFWPCTRKGIFCRNHDQGLWDTCHDYEIRFFCPETELDDDANQFWLIALVGASCIAVPLLIVVALQCFKDFRLNRQPFTIHRQQSVHTRDRQYEELAITGEINQPPPSYDTLFGTTDLHFTTQNTQMSHDVVDSQYSRSTSSNYACSNHAFENDDHNSDRNRTRDCVSISQISSGDIYQNELCQQNQTLPSASESCRNSNTTRQTSQNTRSVRNEPGMHISVFGTGRRQSRNNTTPPPSYNDVMFNFENISTKSSKTLKSIHRTKRYNSL